MSALLSFWTTHWDEVARLVQQHLVLVLVSTAIAIAIGIPAGVLAFRRPRVGGPLLFLANVAQTIPSLALFGFLLLVTQLLPEALIVIPVFAMYDKLGLRENIPSLSLIDAAFCIPIGTWVLKNVFDSIPREIFEAALLDGCSQLGVLWRIMLPIAAPGLVAVSVVSFFYAWNEYLFASNLIQNKDLWPASVGMASLRSMLDTPIDLVLATGLFFSIFPVIFYMLVQRRVVTGLSAGAVKG